MNLRNFFPAREAPTPSEYFLAIEIHESLIKTAVWEKNGEAISIKSIGSFESWDSEESLINGIDLSLTSATKEIADSPDKVVFGLPDSWLDKDGKIHPSKTNLIKKIITDLGLKPLGLLTTSQAIIQQIKSEEGIPPTAILLEVYFSKVVVSVVRLGEVDASEEVGRSGDLARDVEEGLARINADKLPARFILTNGSNLEEEQQQITAYPWTDKLPFIHLPKVEALPMDFSIKSVALIGGQEAGKFSPQSQEKTETSSDETLVAEEYKQSPLEEVGFSIEEESSSSITQKEPEELTPFDSSTPESDNNDLFNDNQEPESNIVYPVDTSSETPIINKSRPKFEFPKPSFPDLSKLSFSFYLKPPSLLFKKWIFLLALPLLLFLTIPLYLFFSKAEINIYVSPKEINQTITADVDGEVKNITGSDTGTISTTGEATVGDKATGKITIYNRSYKQVSVKSGSRVEINNLAYTLNSSVQIASASSDIDADFKTVITPGSVTGVEVTATKIGAESNISKGTQLVVDNQSKTIMVGVAESDFSGGSSRTVKAVSKSDEDKLLSQIIDTVKANIESQINGTNSDLSTVALADFSISKKEFDHDIGEEANSLTLNLSGEQSVLIYSKAKLTAKVMSQLQSQIGSTQTLDMEKTSIQPSKPETTDGKYISQVQIKGVIVPAIDKDKIINSIKGRPVNTFKDVTDSIQGHQSTKVIISPKIPLLSTIFPLMSGNIKISVIAQ